MSRVLGFVLAAVVTAVPTVALANRQDTKVARPTLIEQSSCASAAPSATPVGDAGVTLSVSIPAVAIVHVNARGAIVSALTNTGCAPRTGDLLYVVRPDGTLALSTTVHVRRVHWVGDFTQIGVLQPQPVERRDSN
jgi:hypothetical protein